MVIGKQTELKRVQNRVSFKLILFYLFSSNYVYLAYSAIVSLTVAEWSLHLPVTLGLRLKF